MTIVSSPDTISDFELLGSAPASCVADTATARVTDNSSYRVLVFGGPHLWGAGRHAFAQSFETDLADALLRRSEHNGFIVESVPTRGVSVGALRRALQHQDFAAIDAVVLVLDQSDVSSSAVRDGRRMQKFVESLWWRLVPGANLTIVLCPASVTGRNRQDSVTFASTLRSHLNALIRVVELSDTNGHEGESTRRVRWMDAVATTVDGGLIDPLDSSSGRIRFPKSSASALVALPR